MQISEFKQAGTGKFVCVIKVGDSAFTGESRDFPEAARMVAERKLERSDAEIAARIDDALAAYDCASDDESGEDLYIGWLSPDGDFTEATSDDGSDTGNHQGVAAELAQAIDPSVDYWDAQLWLLGRGWVRIDYSDVYCSEKPTARQIVQVIEWLHPYYGQTYVDKMALRRWLRQVRAELEKETAAM